MSVLKGYKFGFKKKKGRAFKKQFPFVIFKKQFLKAYRTIVMGSVILSPFEVITQ
ncbi:MAG: hypothetical protein V4642_10350 [Bacteroidota bacterium]